MARPVMLTWPRNMPKLPSRIYLKSSNVRTTLTKDGLYERAGLLSPARLQTVPTRRS